MSGPSKFSSVAKTLARLQRGPKVIIPTSTPQGVRSLKLTLATRNAHYGARHFLKEELPRIAYSNPALDIVVERKEHLKDEPWKPELRVEYASGQQRIIDMTQKHSTAILQELLDVANTRTEPGAAA